MEMDRPAPEPFRRKSRKTNSQFTSIYNKASPLSFSTSPVLEPASLQKNKPSMFGRSPNRILQLQKKQSLEEMKKSSQYGIFTQLQIKEEERRQRQSFKTLKKQSLELLSITSRKSMKTSRTNLHSSRDNLSSGQDKLKKSTKTLAVLHETNANQQCLTPTRRSRANQQQLSNQFSEVAAYLEYYQVRQQNYKELYEQSQKKVQELQKIMEEERKKSQRVKQMYREQIRQLRKQKQSGECSSIGHIYCYDSKKQFIPDSVILEQTTEIEPETSLGNDSNLDLSLESR